MTLHTAIQKEKQKLIRKAERSGLYENFGQAEVSKLKDKYIDISSYTDEMNKRRQLLQNFNEWCMSYNG